MKSMGIVWLVSQGSNSINSCAWKPNKNKSTPTVPSLQMNSVWFAPKDSFSISKVSVHWSTPCVRHTMSSLEAVLLVTLVMWFLKELVSLTKAHIKLILTAKNGLIPSVCNVPQGLSWTSKESANKSVKTVMPMTNSTGNVSPVTPVSSSKTELVYWELSKMVAVNLIRMDYASLVAKVTTLKVECAFKSTPNAQCLTRTPPPAKDVIADIVC